MIRDDCGSCVHSEDKRLLWGCDGKKPALQPTEVLFDTHLVRYFHCPMKFFIPKWCRDFIKIYWYYKEFGSVPRYEDQPAKFLLASRVYATEIADQRRLLELRNRGNTNG